MMHAFAELASAQIEARMDLAGREDEIATRVRQIIEQDNLTMVYQPIFGLMDNRVVGVEALARFPDRETRPPNEWFAEAAEIGLGVELELTAVRAALRGLPYLPEDVYLAVNVSPETVLSNKLKPLLDRAPSGRIVLEVTEHAAVSDYPELARALEPLRDHVGIAIDDVGAGYAGMRHILDLKPNIMKLDVSLVRDIHQDPARRALALAMAAFASGIDSELIAEGVETIQELLVLRELGVAKAQGYYLSRPMPLMAVRQFVLGGHPESPPAEFPRTTRAIDRFTQAG
jgi:EAL domain-containing protein (putative c-di-GMP-specific phosphodiesterase class I)